MNFLIFLRAFKVEGDLVLSPPLASSSACSSLSFASFFSLYSLRADSLTVYFTMSPCPRKLFSLRLQKQQSLEG